jgi:tRNA (cmo5U34)-methyltransferase
MGQSLEARDEPGQFHFDPTTYRDMVNAEIPGYLALQEFTAKATADVVVQSILELGVGTGETAIRVLAQHPGAHLVGIDESEEMLEHARQRLPHADLRVSRLEDPLPEGQYELVVAALTVHHLDEARKADLFRRIADVLRPGGRFVLSDVIVPDDPSEAVTPIDGVYDKPSRIGDQLVWLESAGLRARLVWHLGDLAILVAEHE